MIEYQQTSAKPPRTIGLSLAILLSVFLFTVLPLVQIAVLVLIQYRVSLVSLDDTSGANPLAVGGNFGGITNEFLIIQTIFGVVFLITAIFAWRGRPESIRYLMMIGVVVLTIFYAWDNLTALFTPPSFQEGIDSGGGLRTVLQCLRLIGNLLIPLYVLWYINRAPARAFFKGAYPDAEKVRTNS